MSILDVGLRIKHARAHRGASQVAVAKAAGIRQPSLSEIESGETKVLSGDTLIGISTFLRVRPEWIISGHGPMEADEKVILTADEFDLITKYRAASPRWRMALLHLAALRSEAQDEVSEGTMVLLAKAAAEAVPDSALGPKWRRPDAPPETK